MPVGLILVCNSDMHTNIPQCLLIHWLYGCLPQFLKHAVVEEYGLPGDNNKTSAHAD